MGLVYLPILFGLDGKHTIHGSYMGVHKSTRSPTFHGNFILGLPKLSTSKRRTQEIRPMCTGLKWWAKFGNFFLGGNPPFFPQKETSLSLVFLFSMSLTKSARSTFVVPGHTPFLARKH